MKDESSLRLRSADVGDADRLLEWRNDPVTRAASLNRQEIDRAGHLAWLGRRLADPDCALLIVELDGEPVGQLRLDRAGETAEVSIGIAAAARGHGVGRRSLRAVEAETSRWPGVTELVAQVRTENAASLRLFAAGGYEERSRDEDVVRLVKRL